MKNNDTTPADGGGSSAATAAGERLADPKDGYNKLNVVKANYNSSGTDRPTRNNNPFNVRNNPDVFNGEVGTDKQPGGFKVFSDPVYGVRAAFRILRSYENRGLKTLSEKMSEWAPVKDGNSPNYGKDIAKAAGVDINSTASYNDLSYWIKVMPAWAKREGAAKVDGDLIKRAYEMAF